jgi:hypothetical protein
LALLNKNQIEQAFQRLGELALSEGDTVELLAAGGVVMVLVYNARLSTHDVDAIVINQEKAPEVRRYAKVVAEEMGWPEDWLNDGVKGFMVGISFGNVIYSAPGVTVRTPEVAQLLAMKLSAWRDDVDIEDSSCLLQALMKSKAFNVEAVWSKIEPYITPEQKLKARYALLDLWETVYGDY